MKLIPLHSFHCLPIWSAIAVVTMVNDAVAEPPRVPDKLVVLTFDDSAVSHATHVGPLLKKLGFGATFFITEGFNFTTNKKDYMTWEQIAELHKAGFEIGNHTRRHTSVTRQNAGEIDSDVGYIEDQCLKHGIPKPASFCYPGYATSDVAVRVLKDRGYLFARSGGARGFDPRKDDPLRIPQAFDGKPGSTFEKFVSATAMARDGKVAVMTFHGVPDSPHPWVSTTAEKFERYMQHLKDEGCTVVALRDLKKYLPAASSADVPDLTKTLDFEREGDFYLGPTGAKGWMHTASNFMTTDARQILVTEIATDSPADGVLQVGDVILGVNGRRFESDARRAFGHAILNAERTENRGVLKLLRWRVSEGSQPRTGTEETVELKLNVMGTYSDTSPWNCPRTQRILDDAVKVIVEEKRFGRFGEGALALLSTGTDEHREIVREYIHSQKWADPDLKISLESGGLRVWGCGYYGLLLTEYYLATGDEYVLPAISEYAVKTAMGQSNAGTWGHGFAWTSKNDGKLHGRLSGYGAVNQAGLPCFLMLQLAKKCGVEHPEIDEAIEKASRFFQQFIGHGSIGYGFHRPSLEIYANGRNGMSGNGKNGIAAMAFRVQKHREGQRFFSRLTASLYNSMEYGHSGNSYSYFFDPLGANCGGPELASAFLKELRWYYALTHMADGSFVNQQLGGVYGGKLLDPTAAQVLIATLPRRTLYVTGKGMNDSESFNSDEVEETIQAGRWRLADTKGSSVDELIGALGSWSPIARERVAKALAKKDGDFVPRLIALLDHEEPEVRAGACAALGHLQNRAADAVASLSQALQDDGTNVSISASYALARIGAPAQIAIPNLLQALIDTNEPDLMKPRRQAMAYSFGYEAGRFAPLYFDGILTQTPEGTDPLDGVDRALLYPAVSRLLADSAGRTRGSAATALRYFTREDTANMAQEIYSAIRKPAMNYTMMDDGARSAGLDLFARLRLKEGISLCFETIELDRWGGHTRVPARFRTLQAYGGNVKPFLPQLHAMRSRWKDGDHRKLLEETIAKIESDEEPFELISLHDLVDERLARDLVSAKDDASRVVLCRKLMKERPADEFYQAAGLRKLVEILGPDARDDLVRAHSGAGTVLRAEVSRLATEIDVSLEM